MYYLKIFNKEKSPEVIRAIAYFVSTCCAVISLPAILEPMVENVSEDQVV